MAICELMTSFRVMNDPYFASKVTHTVELATASEDRLDNLFHYKRLGLLYFRSGNPESYYRNFQKSLKCTILKKKKVEHFN